MDVNILQYKIYFTLNKSQTSSKVDCDWANSLEFCLASFLMAGVDISFSAMLNSDKMYLATISMGRDCQAISSSFGVVTWSPFSRSRRVTQTTADLMPAMLVKAANTRASISMFDTPFCETSCR